MMALNQVFSSVTLYWASCWYWHTSLLFVWKASKTTSKYITPNQNNEVGIVLAFYNITIWFINIVICCIVTNVSISFNTTVEKQALRNTVSLYTLLLFFIYLMPAWSKYYIRKYHKIINIHGLKGTKNITSLQLHLDRDITDGPLLWKTCPYR